MQPHAFGHERRRQILHQHGDGMSPRLRSRMLVEGLHGVPRGLMGREASPLAVPALQRALSVFKVPAGMLVSVFGAGGHAIRVTSAHHVLRPCCPCGRVRTTGPVVTPIRQHPHVVVGELQPAALDGEGPARPGLQTVVERRDPHVGHVAAFCHQRTTATGPQSPSSSVSFPICSQRAPATSAAHHFPSGPTLRKAVTASRCHGVPRNSPPPGHTPRPISARRKGRTLGP